MRELRVVWFQMQLSLLILFYVTALRRGMYLITTFYINTITHLQIHIEKENKILSLVKLQCKNYCIKYLQKGKLKIGATDSVPLKNENRTKHVIQENLLLTSAL